MTSNEFLQYIINVATISLFIPVGLGVAGWSRLSSSFKVLVVGLGCYLMFLSLFYLHRINIIPWGWAPYTSYIFSLLYGATFTTVYALALPPGRKRWVVLLFGLTAGLYLLVDMLFISAVHLADGLSVTIMTIVLVISTLIFLYYLVRYPTERSLLTVPLFWVAGAKLLSGLGNGLLDVFEPQLRIYSDRLLIYMYIFAYAVIIICNILYAVGIWKERQRLFQPTGLPS